MLWAALALMQIKFFIAKKSYSMQLTWTLSSYINQLDA